MLSCPSLFYSESAITGRVAITIGPANIESHEIFATAQEGQFREGFSIYIILHVQGVCFLTDGPTVRDMHAYLYLYSSIMCILCLRIK